MQFMFLRKIIFLSLEIMNSYDIKKKKRKRKQENRNLNSFLKHTFLIGFFLIKGREKRKRKEAKKRRKRRDFCKSGE